MVHLHRLEEVLKDLVGVLHPYKILENKEIYPYEKRKQSTAHVADQDHDKYYAAAFVGGKSTNFLKMAKVISEKVNEDERNNIVAKWHDESHLNWYQANNNFSLLSPELCFDPSYPQLSALTPKILAVDKNVETLWVR